MSDTPETDHLEVQLGQAAMHSHTIVWNLCRRMERERDEARNELKQWHTLRLYGAEPEYIHEYIRMLRYNC
jgi:hypothetical protein